MKALEIENEVKQELAPAYLLTGDDESLKKYVKDTLLSTIPKEERTFAYMCVDVDSTHDVTDVIMAADTFVFSSSKKMVDVSPFGYKLSAKEENKIKSYFDNPSPSSFVLFEGTDKNLEFLKKYTVIIECKKADEDSLFQYISGVLKKDHYTMNPRYIREFIGYCNYDFGKIQTELDKLMLYCLEEKKIEMSDVELLTPPDLELKAYELTNALNKCDYIKTINILQKLKEQGNEAASLFGLLFSSYRKLLQLAITNANEMTISKVLGMKSGAINVNKSIIENNKAKNKQYTANLKQAVEYMSRLEFEYKMSIIDADMALNLAINNFMSQKEEK